MSEPYSDGLGGWQLTRGRVTDVATGSGQWVEFVPVRLNPDGSTEPQWWEGRETLTLVYEDGRRVVIPWHSVEKAEYTVPKRAAA